MKALIAVMSMELRWITCAIRREEDGKQVHDIHRAENQPAIAFSVCK